MKKFLSLTLAIIMTMSLLVVNASAATTLGKFSDFLTASEKCLGTESSYQWIEASKNSDIYGDVTINKFPVGTYIALKDVYTYYLEISSQPDTVKAGDAIKWVPMTTEFTIPDDHVVYALRVWNQKTGTCKLVYVQGVPGTKATEHTGSIEEGTTEKPRIFSDVPNDAWYQPYVVHCYQSNIMNGVSTTEFAPDRELTRAMVWVMFARLDGQTNIGGSTWYEGARQWAMKIGLSDGTMPNHSVTRQQLITMGYRYWQYKKLPGSNANAASDKFGVAYQTYEFNQYTDTNEISAYAVEPMKWAVSAGLVEPNAGTSLTPAKVLNRAQVAYFMATYYETWTDYIVK